MIYFILYLLGSVATLYQFYKTNQVLKDYDYLWLSDREKRKTFIMKYCDEYSIRYFLEALLLSIVWIIYFFMVFFIKFWRYYSDKLEDSSFVKKFEGRD